MQAALISSLKTSLKRSSTLRRFNAAQKRILGDCHGVFPTYEAAQAAIPKRRKTGYDHPEAAKLYVDKANVPRISDYPVLYWLTPIIQDVRSVVDYGGNLGVAYYTYARWLKLSEDVRWTISDVPEVIAASRKLANERGAKQLTFVSDVSQAEPADVFLTFGTLQYIPEEFSRTITRLKQKPAHVFVNRVPVWEGDTYCTLQDIGPVLCPYLIRNRAEFVRSVTSLGYELVDSWQCFDSTCRVRFHFSRNLDFYSGFYFRLR